MVSYAPSIFRPILCVREFHFFVQTQTSPYAHKHSCSKRDSEKPARCNERKLFMHYLLGKMTEKRYQTIKKKRKNIELFKKLVRKLLLEHMQTSIHQLMYFLVFVLYANCKPLNTGLDLGHFVMNRRIFCRVNPTKLRAQPN